MSLVLFSNFASTQLAGGITNVATTANLLSGAGALFPSPSGGQYFVMEFNDAATGLLYEIVHVTGVVGDTITMVRGQEGTTALNWSAGDLAFSGPTGGTQAIFQQANTWPGNPNGNVAGVAGNTGNFLPSACWNTLNGSLYVCTTTGSSTTAVWTPIAGPDFSVFGLHLITSAGSFSWTVPAGVYLIKELDYWGGGGSGGAPTGAAGSASGGSASNLGIKYGIPVIPGQVITGTVGAGGAGPAAGNAGSAGGTTSVTIGATTYTSPGGPGGLFSNSGNANSPSGASAPTNFDLSLQGSQGQFGTYYSGIQESGTGGSSQLGGLGGIGGGGLPTAGSIPGGGGGGSGAGNAGGAGASGAVYFKY